MYIYNYLHIWPAARNVKNPPANNYGACGAPRCAGMAVWNGGDADVTYYLNRTRALSSVLSHRDPSSPNSLDLRTSKNGHAPARPMQRAAPARGACITKPACYCISPRIEFRRSRCLAELLTRFWSIGLLTHTNDESSEYNFADVLLAHPE